MARIVKSIFNVAIYFVASVGLLGIIVHVFVGYKVNSEILDPVDNANEKKLVLKKIISPNQKYKAIMFENMTSGEGPFLPYSCDNYISVVPSEFKGELAWAKKYRVYEAQCGDPDLGWTSEGKLVITFDVAMAAQDSRVYLQGYDQSFRVKVQYSQKMAGQ